MILQKQATTEARRAQRFLSKIEAPYRAAEMNIRFMSNPLFLLRVLCVSVVQLLDLD